MSAFEPGTGVFQFAVSAAIDTDIRPGWRMWSAHGTRSNRHRAARITGNCEPRDQKIEN